jgi:hypothetical protein
MSVFDKEILATIAFAKVTGTTGAATMNRGFATITRTGPGVYACVREAGGPGAGLAANEVLAHVTPQGATAVSPSTQDTDSVTTTVRTFVSGSPADADFTITISRPTNHE